MALNSALKEGLGVWSRQAVHLGLVCLLDAEASNCTKLGCRPRSNSPAFASTALTPEPTLAFLGKPVPWALAHLYDLLRHLLFHPGRVLNAGRCPSRSLFSGGGNEGRWGALAVQRLCP